MEEIRLDLKFHGVILAEGLQIKLRVAFPRKLAEVEVGGGKHARLHADIELERNQVESLQGVHVLHGDIGQDGAEINIPHGLIIPDLAGHEQAAKHDSTRAGGDHSHTSASKEGVKGEREMRPPPLPIELRHEDTCVAQHSLNVGHEDNNVLRSELQEEV